MTWFEYRGNWIVAGVLVFLAVVAQGQTRMGSVTVNAIVSETVALSVSPDSHQDNVRIEVQGNVNVLSFTLSGSGTDVVNAQVPILVRSNTGYKITGLTQSEAATLANFAVLDVRPTGRFVAPNAFANLDVARVLDSRASSGGLQTGTLPLDIASPMSILTGPRVSLAGTLNSSDNALEVILLLTVKPITGANNWRVRITLIASGDNMK